MWVMILVQFQFEFSKGKIANSIKTSENLWVLQIRKKAEPGVHINRARFCLERNDYVVMLSYNWDLIQLEHVMRAEIEN